MTVEMTPEQALLRVIHCLDRAHDKGFKAKAFARALDVVRSTPADEIADRATTRHADRPRRHRVVDGGGDHPGAQRRRADVSGEDRGRVAGADHRGRPGLPRRAEGRLPPALHVERRRGPDRGDGRDGDGARPRVHGADRPLRSPHDRPRSRPAAADRAARPDRLDQRRHRGGRARLPDPVGYGGRHPRGRRARSRRRHVGATRRRGRQRALETADGEGGDDRSGWCSPSPPRTSTSSGTAPVG